MGTPGQTQSLLERLYVTAGWGRLSIPQEELACVAGERKVWTDLLSLLALQASLGHVEVE